MISNVANFKEGKKLKSKLWLSVDPQKKITDDKWKCFFVYELDNEVVYSVDKESIIGTEFVQYLNEQSIEYEILRIEYKITKKDIDSSEILQLSIDECAGDAVWCGLSEEHCAYCGKEIPRQKEGVKINSQLLLGKDLAATSVRNYSVIVSERFRQLVIAYNAPSVTFIPVVDVEKEEVIDGYYQMVVGGGVGNAVNPTITIKAGYCFQCKVYDTNLLKSVLYFQRSTWDGSDVFTGDDWFGDRLNYDCGKPLLVSKRFYDKMVENGISGFLVKPAYFV